MSALTSMLAATTARLCSKLHQKAKTRPTPMMAKRMPSGSNDVKELPRFHEFADRDDAEREWCSAVDESSNSFGKALRAQTTSHEHDMYMWGFNEFLLRQGFESYVRIVKPREKIKLTSSTGRLTAMRDRAGKIRVVKPQMVLALILDMAAGSEETPKGGHPDDRPWPFATGVDAKGHQPCVPGSGLIAMPRQEQKRKQGEFGYGAYCDEPWSLQAIEKRVYAVRDFYSNMKISENPGYDDRVKAALSTLRLVLGYKPTRIPTQPTTRIEVR